MPMSAASPTIMRRICRDVAPTTRSSAISRRRRSTTNANVPTITKMATKAMTDAAVPAVSSVPASRSDPPVGSGSAWTRAAPVRMVAELPTARATAARLAKAATAWTAGSSRAASWSVKNTAFSNHCGATTPDTT